MIRYLIPFLSLTIAVAYGKSHTPTYTNPELDSLYLEMDELKHALHTTRVDLTLLEEQSRKQAQKNDHSALSSQLSSLEKKLSALDKVVDKLSTDLRTLNAALGQVVTQVGEAQSRIHAQDERLSEVSKLKGTLTTLVKAVSDSPGSSSNTGAMTLYRVKAGDSLEKIARLHHCSVQQIRQANQLSSDKIVIGQELKIHGEP